MKIGIVTIVDQTNFGNRLQNYALSHILTQDFGCQVVTLAARKERKFHNGNYISWLKEQLAGALCVFPVFAQRKWGVHILRWDSFRRWSRRIPTRIYYGCTQIPPEVAGEFDLFLAGSDQIWNPNFSALRFPDYFLTFARPEQRVALSASFGISQLPEELQPYYREQLAGFARLSVREEAGAQIIHSLTGRDATVLPDPALLLSRENWLQVAKKTRVDLSRPYVLKYYLGDPGEQAALDAWAQARGYTVYPLLDPSIPELYQAGPGEFLSLIANAAFVVSDSFHCIALSIVFHRPFVVCHRQGREGDMTSRLDTLLSLFGFSHRWMDLLPQEAYLNCDHSRTDAILAQQRQRAYAYLQSALEVTP